VTTTNNNFQILLVPVYFKPISMDLYIIILTTYTKLNNSKNTRSNFDLDTFKFIKKYPIFNNKHE